MKLAVPIFLDDKIYNYIEIKKPKTGIFTVAYEMAQKGNIFMAMKELISGCIESITSIDGEIIDNKLQIKNIVGHMSYISAEAVALKIMAQINEDDVIEGVYPCPRCGKKIVTEYNKDMEIDTRDRISDLDVKVMDENSYTNEILVIPDEPVKFRNKKTGEVLETVESFTIKYPVLNDCIIAGRNMREGQEIRVQINIYIQSIIKVNGQSVERKWGATWGKLLFEELYPSDIEQISNELQKYGLKKEIERICNNCGKVWEAPVNTSNFFVLGLQSV